MFSRAGSSKGFSAAPPRGLSIQVFLQVYIYMANLLTGVVISNSVFRGGKLLEKLLSVSNLFSFDSASRKCFFVILHFLM